jgi:YD repeat-containing protein
MKGRFTFCLFAASLALFALTAHAENGYQWQINQFPWIDDPTSACSAWLNYLNTPPSNPTCTYTYGPMILTVDSDGYPAYHCAEYEISSCTGFTSLNTNVSINTRSDYFVRAVPTGSAQCGSCVGDPINPANGAVYESETGVKEQPGSALTFKRFYNSVTSGSGDLGARWSHSFSRRIAPRYVYVGYQEWVQSPDNSSLYNDPAVACSSGFSQIKSRMGVLSAATAAYANGICTVSVNGAALTTLQIYSTSQAMSGGGTILVGYDVTRDDGQSISFAVNGSSIAAPPSIGLTLQQTSNGYTLTDANDTVETYDVNGKLLSITSRSGVVQTVSYDTTGRLSSVSDTFGHQLTLGYDNQNRLIAVTRQ